MKRNFLKYAVPAFILGAALGVFGYRFLQMESNITLASLDQPGYAGLKPFVQEVKSVRFGTHNLDTSEILVSFDTEIPTAKDYFELVGMLLVREEWKVIDRHDSFRLYASRWSARPFDQWRYLISVTYRPKDRNVVLRRFREFSYTESPAAFRLAPSPSREASLASYEDVRKVVSVFTQCPASFSPAVQKWIDTGGRLRAATSVTGGGGPLRDALRWIESYSGLVCRFQDDAVILDFPWNRPDERTPAVLLKQLLSSASPSMEKVSGDEWQRAFGALIAAPENIDRAGNIRAEADSKRLFFPARSVDCMFAGTIRDEEGREFAVIVNRQKMQISPGEGFASYYLFDRQGLFLAGGNFSTGWRCSEVTAALVDDGRTLRIVGLHNGTHPSCQDWALKDGCLAVVAGSTCGPGFSSGRNAAPPAIQTPESFPSPSALRSFFFQPGPPTPSLSEVFRSL